MSTGTELAKLSREELEATAAKLQVKNPSKNDSVLIQQIEAQTIRTTLKLEEETRRDLEAKKREELGAMRAKGRRPSPQDICIRFGERVVATFINTEHPANEDGDGADVEFFRGSYHFHLYDSHRFVLPRCMVSDDPLQEKALILKLQKYWMSLGFTEEAAKRRAIDDMLIMSMPRTCAYPTFKWAEDPRSGQYTQKLDKMIPRFRFEIHGPAPEGAELGELMDPDPVDIEDEIAEAMKWSPDEQGKKNAVAAPA